jgi:hypothetical protein
MIQQLLIILPENEAFVTTLHPFVKEDTMGRINILKCLWWEIRHNVA